MWKVDADADMVSLVDGAHTGREPAAKSKMVAVGDCDDRVSATKVAKHRLVGSCLVMSMPPSKNSSAFSEPPSLSGWFHGGVMATLLVMAHSLSLALAPQSEPVPM